MSGLITAVVLFVLVFIVIPVLFKMVFDPEFWLTPQEAAFRRTVTLYGSLEDYLKDELTPEQKANRDRDYPSA